MVRLNDAIFYGYVLTIYWFQFQDGSIKWYFEACEFLAKELFQFQDGSIKCHTGKRQTVLCFEFQFQDGSIKCHLCR